MSLKQQTANALGWNLFDRLGTQAAYLVTGVVLAKLLPVSDFGLIGMLSIFVGLSTILVDGGFSSALIRKQEATESDYSTIFYLNLAVSLLLYLLLFVTAPAIATFYGQPQLAPLARVLFLSLIINSAAIIQSTLYTKQINFKVQVLTNCASLILSGGVAIWLAYRGAGAWALVAQTLLLALSKTTTLWLISSWRPKLIFSTEALRTILGYSSNLLGAQLINTLFTNLYSVVIGRFFSVGEVGYYAQAQKMNDMAASVLNNPIQAATFPIFATIQNDPERLRRAFRKTMRVAMFLTFLAMPLLLLTARPFLHFLLGAKWDHSVIFLQLLAGGSIFNLITAMVNNFLRIPGRTDVLMRLESIKVVVAILLLIVTIPFGALWVIVGQVVARALICINNMIVSGRHIDYPFTHQLRDISPYTLLATASFAAAWPLSLYLQTPLYLLSAQCTLYALTYLLLSWWGNSTVLTEILQVVRKKGGSASR